MHIAVFTKYDHCMSTKNGPSLHDVEIQSAESNTHLATRVARVNLKDNLCHFRVEDTAFSVFVYGLVRPGQSP